MSSAKADAAATEKLYGKPVTADEVLRGPGGDSNAAAPGPVKLLEARSPARPRTTTLLQPQAPVTEATVEIRGLAAGYRAIEKIELAGLAAALSPAKPEWNLRCRCRSKWERMSWKGS
ncbi:MAG: hypothetical protein ACRD4U_04840 [Candidatus Acidiferrales bacterium]